MIVLDASLLIALLDADDAHHATARFMLEADADALAISTLSLAEVAVGPARADRLRAVQEAVAQLDLLVLPIVADAWEALAQLRAGTGLRMPDCCVLHTALQHGAAVATFDRRLSGAAEQSGLRTLGS